MNRKHNLYGVYSVIGLIIILGMALVVCKTCFDE